MLRVTPIESLDLPGLEPYRTLRQQVAHHQERRFVAEGEKVVARLLDSDLRVVSVLLPPEHFDALRSRLEARPDSIEAFVAPKKILETLTGFALYQGWLACARIPPARDLAGVLAESAEPRFVVAVDGLSNAENVGGLVRNAAAFGAQAVVVGETCAHPYLRRAVRASMGSIFQMPLVESESLATTLGELRRRGFHCVAAHPHAEGRELPDAVLAGDCCVVLGSEGKGLSAAVLATCDEAVGVPMQAGVDSLNVGAAGAVFFYEVWRQRRRAAR